MKKILITLATCLVISTSANADFHRIIKNFTGGTCEIISLHTSDQVGSVQFDFNACNNTGQPPVPGGQNYCYLPAGQTMGVVYTTNNWQLGDTKGSLEFKCGTSFDQTVSFSGQDPSFDVDENGAPNISDNHGDICIGVAAGHCQPH